jgi:hypothetical protein
MAKQAHLIKVKATVNLPGLQAGREAEADPNLPWVQDALKNKRLVKTGEAKAPQEETAQAESRSDG